jgi:uncharacterized protein (DUF305 family)
MNTVVRHPAVLRVATVLMAGALAGALAGGCGHGKAANRPAASGSSGPAAAAAAAAAVAGNGHNAQDLTFARRVLLHDAQATELAKAAASHAQAAGVRAFAQSMQQAASAQVAIARARLRAWKVASPAAQADDADEEPGMLATDDVRSLATTAGPDFDWKFLTLMIEHHLGGVTLAQQQEREGRDGPLVALARDMEKAQNDEIATMRKLLGSS